MADVTDPNTAPTHSEIKEHFSALQVVLASFLGATAIIVGLILGIVLVNN